MAQLALYLEKELIQELDRAAKAAGVSRSRFVADTLRARLEDKLPPSFFEVLGTWEDDRSVGEILKDIRRVPRSKRARLR